MNIKKIITYVVLAIIILVSVFWSIKMFVGDKEPHGGVTLSSGLPMSAGNIAAADDPFITLLDGIKNIDLTNLKLLSEPIFRDRLKDLSRPISDRGRGRENPFAQIGTGNLNLGGVDGFTPQTDNVFETATSSEANILPGAEEMTTAPTVPTEPTGTTE